MNVVQPIRSKELINVIKNELIKGKSRNYLLFIMGINTGLRISDLLNLRIRDVKGKDYIQIVEQKTNKIKRFPLSQELKLYIKKFIYNQDCRTYLFVNKSTRKPISRIQAYRIIRNTCKKLMIENIGTHSLRKTFGYHFYNQTRDIAMLQEILNHSSQAITLRYIGITQEAIDERLKNFVL